MTCLSPDIDECNGINSCQQICTNIEGSFECTCDAGFTLDDNNRTCTRKSIVIIVFSLKKYRASSLLF